jgi:hypothetical protein
MKGRSRYVLPSTQGVIGSAEQSREQQATKVGGRTRVSQARDSGKGLGPARTIEENVRHLD